MGGLNKMKKYRVRPYSILWWMRSASLAALMFVAIGVMNSWELGLL